VLQAVSVPAGTRDSCLHLNVQTISGFYEAFYSIGIRMRETSHGVIMLEPEASHSVPSIDERLKLYFHFLLYLHAFIRASLHLH
jgi:hypothetical protein